jgi:hypothetical protein
MISLRNTIGYNKKVEKKYLQLLGINFLGAIPKEESNSQTIGGNDARLRITDATKGHTPRLTPVSAHSRIADQPYSVEHVDLQRHIYAEHNKTFRGNYLLPS